MTRSFLFLIGLAALLGVGLGGAFILGVAFGKGQADATADVQGVAAFGPGGPQAPGFAGRNQPGGLQQGPGGAGSGPTGDAGANSISPDQRGGQVGGDRALPAGGVMGTVESVEGNTVTIGTPQGTLRARLREDTAITRIAEAGIEDLQVGDQVRVMGQEVDGEEGIAATSVTIIPQGVQGTLGRGLPGEEGLQQDETGQ